MKSVFVLLAPLGVVFFAASCQTQQPVVTTLPPVAEEASRSPSSRPSRSTSRSTTRSTSSSTSSSSTSSPAEEVAATTIQPLTPDPTAVTPVSDIPRYEVPENVQPQVSDGINQAEFIELKW